MMKKLLIAAISFCLTAAATQAKMLPQDGAMLNYTQVMFEYDQVAGATKYQLTIKETNTGVEKKDMLFGSASLAFLVKEGLAFGHTYTWKVDALQKGKIIHSSPWMNFSIGWSQKIDSGFVRYHINAAYDGKAKKYLYQNGLLFMDHLGVLINHFGQPVWYYPDDKLPQSNDQFNFRAMRMTRDGNVTFIYDARSMERGIDGFPYWDAPRNTVLSGAEVETYHHDLQKMPDGSYITLGYHFEYEPHYLNPALQAHVRYNTVLQFDSRNNLMWYWNEKDHVEKSLIFRNYGSTETEIAGTHMNGFAFNPTDSSMVMSFRNSSEVIKADLKHFGKVVYHWEGPPSIKNQSYGINFLSQHGPTVTPEGNIIIYNNNISPDKTPGKVFNPKIVIVSNPTDKKHSEKLWEYEIAWDKKPGGVQGKEGYALTLPNKDLLVNVGGAERTFEITPDKKIVWDCTYEKLDSSGGAWKPFYNYRCAYTSSLFPVYFTAEHIYEGKNKTFGSTKINNDGTDDDVYEIEVTDATGNIIAQKKMPIKAGASMIVNWLDKARKGKYPETGVKVKIWPEGRLALGRILIY